MTEVTPEVADQSADSGVEAASSQEPEQPSTHSEKFAAFEKQLNEEGDNFQFKSEKAAAAAAPPVPGGQAAPPTPGTPAPEAPKPVGFDEWSKNFGGVNLSEAPQGAGIPLDRATEMHQRLLASQREAEQLRASLNSFRGMFGSQAPPQQAQQPQIPVWAQQPQPAQQDDLADLFGETPQQPQYGMHPAFYKDWQAQQQTIQQMQQQMQAMSRHYGQMQLREQMQGLQQRFPDVHADTINLAIAAGMDPELIAMRAQARVNELRAQFQAAGVPAAQAQAAAQQSVANQASARIPTPPRPAAVGGGQGAAPPEQPWDALDKSTDKYAWAQVKSMMQNEGVSLAEIQQSHPHLWRKVMPKAV